MVLNLEGGAVVKNFADLTEREVLAVAISAEEEDSRIYMTFAEDLAERYPDSAKLFQEMAEEERGHRHRLVEIYCQRFCLHPQGSRDDGTAGRAGLPQGRRTGRGCRRAPFAWRSRRRGKGSRETGGQA